MFTSRVVSSQLNSRLDARFYDPRYALAESRLRSSGLQVSRFEQHLARVFKGAFYILAAEYANCGIPFIRVSQISGGELDLSAAVFLPPDVHRREQKTAVRGGDILFAKGGTVGACAHVPGSVTDANISQDIIGGRLKATLDPCYASSYFRSSYGRLQILRWAQGDVQPHISNEAVWSFLVPDIERHAQRYIGDKVRKAERLRERARTLRGATSAAFSAAGLLLASNVVKRVGRVRAVDVLDRLDSLHYRSDLLENLQAIRRHPTVLLGSATDFADLADGDHGNPVYGNGPIYVRATELAGDTLDSFTEARLDERYSRSLPSSVWATSDDVLFSIVGTLGAVGILEDGGRAVLSRGVAKVRPLTLQKHYVKAFMRTRTFANELLRRSVGTIQRGAYLESLDRLEIPVLDEHTRSIIARNEQIADESLLDCKHLTRAACFIVEHLIEGRVSESDLVAAQKALEAGDRSADRAILQSLRQSDTPDAKPLIRDLDGMYALLDESEANDE